MPRLTQQDFEKLLEFRVTLRRFQRWSEDQAQAEGLTACMSSRPSWTN
jgi:hypothetical protein